MPRSSDDWPAWWERELDCSNPHQHKRTVNRRFTEYNPRDMLDRAVGYEENHERGRSAIGTTRNGRNWEVIVEPGSDAERLVVTAYSTD